MWIVAYKQSISKYSAKMCIYQRQKKKRLNANGYCAPSKAMDSAGTGARSLVMEQIVARLYLSFDQI